MFGILRRYSSAGYQFWFPINPVDLSNVTTKMGEIAPWQFSYWFNMTMTKHGELGHLAGYNQFEYSSHEVGMALSDLRSICLWACMSCFWDEWPFWRVTTQLSVVQTQTFRFHTMMRKQVIWLFIGLMVISNPLATQDWVTLAVKSLWLRHGYGR